MTSDRSAEGLARQEFVALYEETHGAIFRYGARRVGEDVAEELTSSTFADAWAARGRYDATLAMPATWIWAIATKLVNKHLRSEARRRRAMARLGYEPFTYESTDDSDRRMDAEKQWSEVAQQIAGLDARDRDILFLFAWSDLTYEEISEVIGIPIGTVKSRLSRARARLGVQLIRAVS